MRAQAPDGDFAGSEPDHPLVMVRFNPDGYVCEEKGKVTSPWRRNKQGFLTVTKTRQAGWDDRLVVLTNTVKNWIETRNEKLVEIFQQGIILK